MNEKSCPAKAANPLTENCSHSSALDPLYESRLTGWLEGYHSRDAEVAKLEWTADRLYTEVCRRTPPKQVDLPSYASLEAKRAEIYGGAR